MVAEVEELFLEVDVGPNNNIAQLCSGEVGRMYHLNTQLEPTRFMHI
jgi:hypothetical protein